MITNKEIWEAEKAETIKKAEEIKSKNKMKIKHNCQKKAKRCEERAEYYEGLTEYYKGLAKYYYYEGLTEIQWCEDEIEFLNKLEGNGIFEFTEIENRIKKLKTHLTYLKKEEKKL